MAASGEVPPEIYSTLMGFDISRIEFFPPFFCCLPLQVIAYLKWRRYDLNSNRSRINMWNEFQMIQSADAFAFDQFKKSLSFIANGEKTFFEILDEKCVSIDFHNHPFSRTFMLLCLWISLVFWEKQIKHSTEKWFNIGEDEKDDKHHYAGCFYKKMPKHLKLSKQRFVYPKTLNPSLGIDYETGFHQRQCEQTARDIHRMLTAFTISWVSLSEQQKKKLMLEFPFITGLMYQSKS